MNAVDPSSEVLVDPDELAGALGSRQPPVVADVRWSLGGPPGLADFQAGHIPGAQWVDLEHDLSGPPATSGGRHPLPDPASFERAMRRIGVSSGSPVVVCDAGSAVAAARLWWLLTDAGHVDVRVLDGGFAAWQASGSAVRQGAPTRVPSGDFSVRPGQRRRVDAAQLAARLAQDEPTTVVDVRAPERYSGAVEPIDPVAGHIPGAINLPSMANLDDTGRFLDAATLATRYAAAGVDETAVVYCGSGITAAHTLLALARAGVGDAFLYPGSWSDWVSDPARPVTSGDRP